MVKDSLIFIVDDDEMWSTKLQQILSDVGFNNVQLFSNGEDCLASTNQKPAVVFLDFQMEKINGLLVLLQLKAGSPESQVVFCTGNQDISVAIKAIQFGSTDYLLKSNVSQKEMKRIIKTLQVQ